MAKNDNLTDFLTGIADTIRTQKNTSGLINPQDFESEISGLTDVSDTTAVAGDVLSGKDFYLADGTKTSGSIETYSGATKRTSNGTFSTANKYLATDLTVNVNPAEFTYRWINPTIIRITTTTANQQIKIYFSEVNQKIGMNWGDNSARDTTSSRGGRSHTYSAIGTYNIVISVEPNHTRNALASSSERNYFYKFDDLMFYQTSSQHFTPEIEIFFGDCVWFDSNCLSYCDNIKTLDFSNLNSLLESPSSTYMTFKDLPSELCRYSIIKTLVLGTSIKSIGSQGFRYSTIIDVIIKDTRTTGANTSVVSLPTAESLGGTSNVTRILVQNGKLNAYRNASNWSAYSSKIYAY